MHVFSQARTFHMNQSWSVWHLQDWGDECVPSQTELVNPHTDKLASVDLCHGTSNVTSLTNYFREFIVTFAVNSSCTGVQQDAIPY